MARNRRNIFVKGLGTLAVRQVDPVVETAYVDVGWLGETKIEDVYDMEDIRDERGILADVLEHGQTVTLTSKLIQSAKAQVDFMKGAAAQYHSLRYFGMEGANTYKYFCFEIARIIPGASMEFKPGLRSLNMVVKALDQQDATFDIPMYYLAEAAKEMRITGLNIWLDPRQGLNKDTNRIIDISGFGRHGTLSADFATIWQTGTTPERFLRLDGSNDIVTLGDYCDIDATGDFMIEAWVRIQGADATQQEILAKKAADANEDGFRIIRTATNTIEFKLSDGTSSVTAASVLTLLQNVWKHVAIVGDRNGNVTIYFNGVATGTPASIAALADASNTESIILGKLGASYGQVDLGAVRFHAWAGGGLPSDIATVVANHYAAEKAFYGL